MSILRYGASAVLILTGILTGGLAFSPVNISTTATPTSSRPEQKAIYHPASGLNALAGMALIGTGLWLALKDGEEKEERIFLPPDEAEYYAEPIEEVEEETHEQVPLAPPEKPEVVVRPAPTRLQVEPNYEEVRSLVFENSLAIVGQEKGSGKTSKLGWLVGEHIKQGHLVWFCNPFAPFEEFHGLKVFGRGLNYEEVVNCISLFSEIAKERIRLRSTSSYNPFDDVHIHLALDEVSNYADELQDIDETVLSRFWIVAIQFVRQANMSFGLATHGLTKALMGGKALDGKFDTIQKGVTQLYAQAKLDPNVLGGKRCRGTANLIHYEGDNRISTQIQIPNWMQGPPKYDYTQLVQEHLPHYDRMNEYYLTGKWQSGEAWAISNVRSQLKQQETDIWEDEDGRN